MCRLPNGPKGRYEKSADTDQDGTYEGVSGERFPQNQGCKNRIKDESGLFIALLARLWGSEHGETLTAWRVDNTGSGSVVICIVLPTMFEMTNISMPSCRTSVPLLVEFVILSIPAIFDACMVAGGDRRGVSRPREYAICAGGSIQWLGDWSKPVQQQLRPITAVRVSTLSTLYAEIYRSWGKQTATLPCGDRSPKLPITSIFLHWSLSGGR